MNLNLSIGRDLVVHFLLTAQLVVEHTQSHLYGVQVGILVLLVLLYRKQVAQMGNVMLKLIKKILRRNVA